MEELEHTYVVDEAKEERYRRAAELRTGMANLAACLRVGAALCRAWKLGSLAGTWGKPSIADPFWIPGCGRPAPGVD